MGLDPATMQMIGMIAGPALGSLFGGIAGGGQELSSFEGHAGVDPVTMLQNANSLIGRVGRGVTERAATPISLPSAYVQQVPAFTGGGLPMPIGVVGSDPALVNPSLMNLQGMGQFQDLFSGLDTGSNYGVPTGPGTGTPPGAGVQPGETGTDPNAEGFQDFYQPRFDQRTPQNPQGTTDGSEPRQGNAAESVTRRKPAQLVRGADLLAEDQGGDDMQRAVGAVKLLLQSMEG